MLTGTPNMAKRKCLFLLYLFPNYATQVFQTVMLPSLSQPLKGKLTPLFPLPILPTQSTIFLPSKNIHTISSLLGHEKRLTTGLFPLFPNDNPSSTAQPMNFHSPGPYSWRGNHQDLFYPKVFCLSV